MAINRLHFSDLKDGCCKKTVVAQLLRFWDARNLKKVGEHLGLDLVFLDKKVSENEQLMALANTNVDFPGWLLLNATPGTSFFDNECLAGQSVPAALYGSDDGSSSTASKYGSVKKIERVTLAELNNYVLNSPPQTAKFLCTAEFSDIDTTNGWCYFSYSKCYQKLQRRFTSFTCAWCMTTLQFVL
ncbi:hypothetical protein F2Q69_00037077 [Brassica cretica]|uniref:Uncharacterized protein n=1 Tax=Brassica cretica TaxID=69181 RepID=A0A8S9SMI1_BRACR|nr:hypothetical protein F2Q69_00037077 [Brassica cretica]